MRHVRVELTQCYEGGSMYPNDSDGLLPKYLAINMETREVWVMEGDELVHDRMFYGMFRGAHGFPGPISPDTLRDQPWEMIGRRLLFRTRAASDVEGRPFFGPALVKWELNVPVLDVKAFG